MRKTHIYGFVLNSISGMLVLLLMLYQKVVLSISGPWHITILDRAGVISEERLMEYDPSLVQNMRYSLGNYITQKHDKFLTIVFLFFLLVVACNFLIFIRCVVVHNSQKHKSKPSDNKNGNILPIEDKYGI